MIPHETVSYRLLLPSLASRNRDEHVETLPALEASCVLTSTKLSAAPTAATLRLDAIRIIRRKKVRMAVLYAQKLSEPKRLEQREGFCYLK